MKTRCNASCKDGSPCTFAPWAGGAHCLPHAAAAGDEAARGELQRRGEKGRQTRTARAIERLDEEDGENTFDSVRHLLAALMHAYRNVRRCNESATAKANAIQRLVSTAADLLKANELEATNRELRELLLERHPELRKHLKAVS